MLFTLSEEQLAVQSAAREFAERELKPGVIERDRAMQFPAKQVEEMGRLGFLGMTVSAEYGGSELDQLSYVLALEEIAKIDASAAVIMSVNCSLVCWGIEQYGSPAQKDKYLQKLATGDWLGAFCLSEPEAGSDATHQRTTAIDYGDHYLLNGTKNWITNGSTSDLHIVMAQCNQDAGHRGINAFLVEADWPGVEIGPKEDKLGIRASDTTSITYNGVKVPKENRLGDDGFGFKFAMKTLSGGRIGIAAQALGIAAGACDLAKSYAQERETFGQPIVKHQGISFKLAEMATEIEAARLLVYHAAQIKDQGKDYDLASSMAKLFAAETAMKQAVEAVQIHGGYGYVKEYHVERLMRDAKITQIYEGTSEIQKIVISRKILDGQLYPSIFVN